MTCILWENYERGRGRAQKYRNLKHTKNVNLFRVAGAHLLGARDIREGFAPGEQF